MSGIRSDLVAEIAREVMGRPDAHMGSIEWLSVKDDGIDATRVEMWDAPLVARGPRAGLPNWSKRSNPERRIFLPTELKALAEAWSLRTGKCIACTGTGREFVRWSVAEGATWRPCPACEGTGGPGASPAVEQGALL